MSLCSNQCAGGRLEGASDGRTSDRRQNLGCATGSRSTRCHNWDWPWRFVQFALSLCDVSRNRERNTEWRERKNTRCIKLFSMLICRLQSLKSSCLNRFIYFPVQFYEYLSLLCRGCVGSICFRATQTRGGHITFLPQQ